MSIPVKTVASGGLPVMDATVGSMAGMTVTEAPGGMAVTKVSAGGLPVTFVSPVGGGGGGTTYATWDAATVTAVTLSGGNLVATNTGTTSADQGAKTNGKTTGKYYFEITLTTFVGGGNTGVGIGTTASTYTGMGGSATTGTMIYMGSGNVWIQGGNSGQTFGARASGNVICVAVDLDNRKLWFRIGASGLWNTSAGNDPVNNTGGHPVSAGTVCPFVPFGGIGGVANNIFTTNFGASAFAGAVPSGFTSGWPI
jgi:hypothetical protein